MDSEYDRALKAYDDAINSIINDPNSLYVSHTSAWEEVWSKNGFVMVADGQYGDVNSESFKLAQRLYSSFYNLYASIPYTSTADVAFYGLGPAGLAYGGLKSEYFNSTQTILNRNMHISEAYGGHLMYHQELWILPLISMFSYDMSKHLISSRVRRGLNVEMSSSVYDQARENAKNEGFDGVRYAWEQGDFGVEVSPFQDAKKGKIHTSADVSFGIRSYLRMSLSREFLSQSVSNEVSVRGEDLINEIAKYWAGRMKYNPSIDRYEINGNLQNNCFLKS